MTTILDLARDDASPRTIVDLSVLFRPMPVWRICTDPNLVVEVLSASNTAKEMRRKLREYFKAGVELVWYVDPASHTVEVFTAPQKRVVLKAPQSLTGGHVLPGFRVTLKKLFGG